MCAFSMNSLHITHLLTSNSDYIIYCANLHTFVPIKISLSPASPSSDCANKWPKIRLVPTISTGSISVHPQIVEHQSMSHYRLGPTQAASRVSVLMLRCF